MSPPPKPRPRARSSVPITTLLFGLVAVSSAVARQPETADPELPAALAEEIVAFVNDPGTLRVWGGAHLPAGTRVAGNVAVLNGRLVLAGSVEGRIAVINADVSLEPGSRIVGDLTVVGGAVEGEVSENVTGRVVAYPQPLRYRRDGDVITYTPYRTDPALSAGRDLSFGRVDITIASRQSYNRVEGLPISIGPTLELGRSNPTRIEVLAVQRTETGLRVSPGRTGYFARFEQAFGGRHAIRAGVTLRSEIAPIESWGLSNREASLATFVLHRDYRDHYEREGHSVYIGLGSPAHRTAATIEYRDEKHRLVQPSGPWTLFGNDDDWRPQPAIATGALRSLAIQLRYDTRNATGDASTGWFVTAEVERGLSGNLRDRVVLDPEGGEALVERTPANTEFSAAFLDVRRYARVSPGSRIALRALVAGSIDGDALPPQRQHALGGEGSLPGYRLFAFDCGARRRTVEIDGEVYHPYYGCDRLMLMQLEYEARLPFASGLGQRLGWPFDSVEIPAGVVFVNAGRAWNEPGDLRGRERGRDDFATDAGFGLRIGGLGFYWAFPLSGGADGVNFFVRLGSRP